MNYGILHNRRPDKAAAGARNPLLGDARMREIAKQMGLEPKDFGKEAMNMWNMLDEMAESDPSAYQAFISEQLKHGPPMTTADDSAAGTSPRYFNPKPGCVVKCTMRENEQEIKLFVNICTHELVDIPKNPNSDREVARDTRVVPTTSNLQIPLVIGEVRKIKDFSGAACRAVDVVFHPWVMERCEWNASFKRDVLQLALTWVQQDAGVQLATPVGKFIKSQYKGGVTMGDQILTTKFLIDPQQQNTRTLAAEEETDNQAEERRARTQAKSTIAIDTPSALLKQMNISREDESSSGSKSDFLIKPVGETDPQPTRMTQQNEVHDKKPAPRKKLIEVIEPKEDNQANETASIAQATPSQGVASKTKSSVVKKGFLNSTKKQLYPTGSSEGRAPSAYVNLMSRSKVVDLSAVEQQKAEQQKEQKERDDMFSFLKRDESKHKTVVGGEIDHADHEFEQLCMAADPDLVPEHTRAQQTDRVTEDLFGPHLDEFAKFLSSQS